MKTANLLRFNCDHLWKLWYSLIVTVILIILIGLGISNYSSFKSQSIDSSFGNQWSSGPPNFQLFAIILSFSLLILFIYSCTFKVENIANDGIELGNDAISINEGFKNIALNKGVGLFLLRLKSHFLPYNCLLHVIIALLLALPLPLMQAEQIKNEAMSPEYLWTTDIDYLINPQASSTQKRNLPSYLEISGLYLTKPSTISLEFLNLILSLLILTVRISSPFWYTNKAFSIIFSLFTFATSFAIAIEYELLVLFTKVTHNSGSNIMNIQIITRTTVPIALILSFIKSLLMLFMLMIVFEYGYTQYLSSMRKYRQYFSSDISDSVSQQSHNNQQLRWYQVAPRLLGVVLLVFIIIVNIYLLLLFMEFYFQLKDTSSIVIFNLGISIIYSIMGIFLWFGLCIKNKWQFHINIQTNPIPNVGPGKLAGSPEPIYGCFYNATSGSSQTSLSRPILRSSIDGSEGSSYRIQSGNYVMMQSGNQVLPIRESMEYNVGESEASYGSQTKSFDSNDPRYRPYMFQTQNIDGSQYATLASLKSGVLLTSRALSDSSSTDTATKSQSRRSSNRVTFKEQLYSVNLNRFSTDGRDFCYSSTSEIPDILPMNAKSLDKPLPIYPGLNGTQGIDPSLEMSTDMRLADNSNSKVRDPRLCSQV